MVDAPLDKGSPLSAAATLFDDSVPFPVATLRDSAMSHNIELMRRFCDAHGVALAPHGKTTMSAEVIRRQLAAGAWAITVATAWQADMVAAMGVERILLANQLVDPGSIRLVEVVLDRHPRLEFWCYVDSAAGLDRLTERLRPDLMGRVTLMVELGVLGVRTGLRDDTQALELARRVAASPFALGGVAAFEGNISANGLAATLTLVDDLLDRLERLAVTVAGESLFGVAEPVVSVGGSAYFDRVVHRLPAAVAGHGVRVILRSGCYVTHDHGTYRALSPLDGRAPDDPRLRPALEVWAVVLSRPEPTMVVVGLGRRDVSADAGLPVPLRKRSGGSTKPVETSWHSIAINDQHVMIAVPADADVAVGDLLGFGISHPCTTFDKWHQLLVIDDDDVPVRVARTCF